MSGAARIERPADCGEHDRAEFTRLVRQGFGGSDAGLPGRIAAARRLAFHYTPDGTLAAIAGLKAPGERYRQAVFEMAAVPAAPADYELELGWLFVLPAHRGRCIAEGLCRRLLKDVPGSPVFATTRPDNAPMIRILDALGFARAGRPYPHPRRQEVLTLFLRPPPATEREL